MSKTHYISCPLCNSSSIDPLMTVKDHSVSHEDFVIWQCRDCNLRFTQDVPDEDEIGRYYQSPEYISHSDTDQGMVNKVYKKVRNFTLEQKASLIISNTKPKGAILDIGSGTGAFLSVMNKKGWETRGVEPDQGAREQAIKLYGLELLDKDGLHKLEGGYDAITLWHVLEHVHQLHDYLELLKSKLENKGRIFIAVPNFHSLDADIYKSRWAAYDVPRHLYHFSPQSISKLASMHGLRIISKKPMWFDSFYISLLSSRYKYGKPTWISAGFNGLRSNLKALFNKDKCSSLIYILEKV